MTFVIHLVDGLLSPASLYGPQSLTRRQLVGQIGDATGRPIRFVELSVDEARAELGKTIPPIGVEAILRYWASSNGRSATVSTIVGEVTGHPAHTFAQWAEDHAADFR